MVYSFPRPTPPSRRPAAQRDIALLKLRRREARGARRERSVLVLLAVVGLLAIHGLLGLTSARRKSTSFDEIAHLVAGVSLLQTGDYRLLPEHPPLPHVWAALPTMVGDFVLPEFDGPAWWTSNHWKLGKRFFYELGNDPQAILARSRTMMMMLSVALGLVVWCWSRRLFGVTGGMLSLALYAFSPTMLAHGRLITTDLPAGLFFLLAAAALWRMLHRISPLSLALTAVAVAALLLSKMSAPIALPIAGVLVVVRLVSNRPTEIACGRRLELRSRLGQLAAWLAAAVVQVLLVVLLIWAAYGFRYPAMRDAEPSRDRFFTPVPLPSTTSVWKAELAGLGRRGAVITWMRDHRLLPEGYLFGLTFALQHAQARQAFLNGETRVRGWWYFFPYCLAVKTPLPLFGLLSMAVVAAIVQRRQRRSEHPSADSPASPLAAGLYRTAPLWAIVFVYGGFAIASNLNIGHRHLLPIYPVLFILAGRAGAWLRSTQRPPRWLASALTVLFIGSSLLIWPHYLAYFNSLVGGPGGAYKHLVDSSLDWGQDLSGLKRWLDLHHAPQDDGTAATPVYLAYFGTGLPGAYGIEARMLPGYLSWEPVWVGALTRGVYCVSATMLHQLRLLPECRWTDALEAAYQDLRDRLTRPAPTASGPARLGEQDVRLFHMLRFARLCATLRQRAPDDNVGHSILIYRLDDDEVRRALSGPPGEQVPGSLESLRRLGSQCLADGCYTSAVVFLKSFIQRQPLSAEPESVAVATHLGIALTTLGRNAEAIAAFREGLAHAPNHAKMNNGLAWLLATSPSARLRDGAEALRRATIALDAAAGRKPSVLDTLAAAHAELGQFDQARRYARIALEMAREAGLEALAARIAARLALYESNRPCREP